MDTFKKIIGSVFNFIRNLTSNLTFLVIECALSIPLTVYLLCSNSSTTVITVLSFSLWVYGILILDLLLKLWNKEENFWNLSEDFRREFFIMKATINVSSFALLAILVECSVWLFQLQQWPYDDDFYDPHPSRVKLAHRNYHRYCLAASLYIMYFKVAYQGIMLLLKIASEIFNGKLHQFIVQICNNICFLWLRFMSLLFCLCCFNFVDRRYLADCVIKRDTLMGKGSLFAVLYSATLLANVWGVTIILLFLHCLEFMNYSKFAENCWADRDFILLCHEHLFDNHHLTAQEKGDDGVDDKDGEAKKAGAVVAYVKVFQDFGNSTRASSSPQGSIELHEHYPNAV